MAKLSTQAKFVLGAAATGAYLGDITEDPVGGLMGSLVLGGTATFMKLTTSDIKKAGQLPSTFKLDSSLISQKKNQGYTDEEIQTLSKLKKFIATQDRHARSAIKAKKKFLKNSEKILNRDSKLTPKQYKKLMKTNAVISKYIQQHTPEALDSMAVELAEKLKTFGTHITPNYEGLKNYVSAITDAKEASRFLSLSQGASPFSAIDAEDSIRTSQAATLKLQTNRQDALPKLSEYFQKQFNNAPEIALEKARLILERNAGDMLTVKGGSVLYTDKFSGKSEMIPITAVTNQGVFYNTPKPGTNFAVTAANPYGTAYATRTPVRILGTNETRVPTFEDVTKRIHPELLALQVSEGADIGSQLDIVRSQLRHGLDESAVALDLFSKITDDNISQRFRAAGSSTDYQHTLNYDINGKLNTEKPLRKLSMISQAGGTAPEGKAVLTEIMEGYLANNPDMADNLLNNISLNNTTTLSGVDFQSIAPLSMNQRGATAVGVRDMVASNRTQAFDLLSGVYSGFDAQFQSSNVFDKLDVANKAQYNQLMDTVLGTSHVLADGSGFFKNSLETSGRLSAVVSDRLKIGRQPNGSLLIQDERLKDLLDTYKKSGLSTGINEKFIEDYQKVQAAKRFTANYKAENPDTGKYAAESFEDYLKIYNNARDTARVEMRLDTQPFTLEAGQTLGFDASGKSVGLHKQYTSAELTGLLLDEDGNLLLHSKATFNPEQERIAKIFSEASKSNLFGMLPDKFEQAAVMGVLLNENVLQPLTSSTDAMYNQIEDAREGVRNSLSSNTPLTPLQQKIYQAMNSDIILAAEDTNTQGISTLFGQKSVEGVDKALTTESKALKLQLSDKSLANLNRMSGMTIGDTSPLMSKKLAALSTLMQGNFKAATDLNLTATHDVFSNYDKVVQGSGTEQQQKSIRAMLGSLFEGDDVDQLLQNSGNTRQRLAKVLQESTSITNLTGANSQSYQDNLYKFTHGLTESNLDEYAAGMLKSVGAVNKGQAVLGVGNHARMSWTAYNQLLKSGFTKEDLQSFGQADFKTQVELQGIFGERFGHSNDVASFAINNQIGNNTSNVERLLLETIPENRVSSLKTMGIDVNEKSKFITYRLKNSYKDLEYLNFATMTGNHSGVHDDGLKTMMKELERSRIELFSLDNQLAESSDENRGAVKAAFTEAAEKYKKLSESLLKGDNSLVKKAASLMTNQSNISLAMAVGGEASAYIQEQVGKQKIPNGVFISKEGLALRAERMGLKAGDIDLFPIDGYQNLSKVKYKVNGEWLDLKSLITREPAQGPLATTYEDLILDNSLESKGNGAHLFVTENHIGFSKGKYLDYDQDTLQELFGKLGSKAEQDILNTKFAKISSSLDDLIPLANLMKVKGSNNTIYTPLDFENKSSIVSYKNTAGIQGRERKSLAGVATRLATNLSQALDMEFDETAPEKAVRGRFLGHVVVENLLKSAHLSTMEFAKQAESDIESLSRLRGDYVSGKIDAKSYKTEIEPIYRRSLNLNNPDITGQDKTKLDGILSDLLTAEVNQAKLVSSEARTPLDIAQSKIKGTIIDKAKEVLSNFIGMDYETDLQGTRSYGRMAREIKVNIASTLKNNKGILGVGAAALALGSIVTRDGAEVSEERERMIRGNGGKIHTGPQNVPMGINTNTTATSYVTPKVQNTGQKSVEVQGDFAEYAEYGDASNYMDKTAALSSAIFGDNLRTARLE